ncbi:MAG: DNA gyrase subunit A [Candidatus Dadabacteria bacterium]|jgi:DNA gyrase subunit A|nr:DNA gyrase subunit A [Candidatus Dadabacteria bacterium]MCZ6555087.1 DNA gyrase subunit A [Candidatus Dadabacteria bacterium]MCZ6685215.1 DNA gyrase subunit A [Candidatus Dadabacteria bacterium]MCZ6791293.1 DNA gyrase subunit A [Candidatus Dadabacteria bacterium]MCZ6864684.1 DNA gyrase subunit A [Candidatus Dadabacteria bacterium]
MTTPSQIIPINIEDEMKESYLSYSMSVIVGRALPDVRDGLKPVHRRILFGMDEAGNQWNRPYKKSARIVGEVMGKYHPHGDAAIYDTLVRMAQDFSMRYTLVDGQGNFGSIDGDPPAAMRYTEVRLDRIATEMLDDLEKETVDFAPNYDGSEHEPLVLPSRIPNLLLNGSSGIAVGMATNIPPHNLIELINAVVAQANNPGITLDELMTHMPGPDFPTGGFITGKNPIREAYETGRGIIKLRAKARIEKQKKGDREVIIVNEIPYQVNKSRLIERIADLVKEDKIKGISDIRDESDRDGIRVVVDIKRGEIAEVVLNQLYKHTPMDTSFGIIMLALVRNQPRVMPLKEIINHFIEHRKEVVTRRTQFELAKAEARLHILEGLKIALDHLDEVIALIRKSASPQVAKDGLMQELGLSDIQGQAILEMRLQRLTALERDKILDERKELIATVKRLNEVLDKENLILGIVTDELKEIKDRYGDVRKTEILDSFEEISIEDLIADEDMVVTITHDGYIKTTFLSIYRSQRRGGKGRTGMTTKDMDFVEDLFIASQHNYVLFFSNHGKCYWLKVHEIPEAGPTARGKALINLLNLAEGEKVAAVLPVIEFKDDQYIIMATKNGVVKKTKLMAYSKPRVGGIIALNIRDDDELIEAKLTSGNDEILISSHFGQAIRFKEENVRDMGRTATGVRGIRLDKGDQVVSLEVIANSEAQILTVTEKGYGKRTLVSKYRITGRGGKGVITIKTTGRNGRVVGVFQVTNDTQIMMITTHGGKVIRMNASEISVFGRGTQGVKLIGLAEDEMVASVAKVVERE